MLLKNNFKFKFLKYHLLNLFLLTMSFPSANETWVYDATIGMWHQRGRWNTTHARYDADVARFHAYVWGKHFVGGGDGTERARAVTDMRGLRFRGAEYGSRSKETKREVSRSSQSGSARSPRPARPARPIGRRAARATRLRNRSARRVVRRTLRAAHPSG